MNRHKSEESGQAGSTRVPTGSVRQPQLPDWTAFGAVRSETRVENRTYQAWGKI